MATFRSKAMIGGVPYRATAEKPFEVTATILVPNGTAIAASDVFQFFKLGANIDILSYTLRVSDLDTGAAITLHGGYDLPTGTDDPDAFVSSSVIGQAGGQVRVENGGDDPFAVGALAPQTEIATITATCAIAPAGNPTTDRYLTCTVKAQARAGATSDVPYVYADRYNTSGVGSI
jgi:hypothetical protein